MSAEWVLAFLGFWGLSMVVGCRIAFRLGSAAKTQQAGIRVVLRGIDIDREAEAMEDEQVTV